MDLVIILMCVSTKGRFYGYEKRDNLKQLSLIKICRYAAATSLLEQAECQ